MDPLIFCFTNQEDWPLSFTFVDSNGDPVDMSGRGYKIRIVNYATRAVVATLTTADSSLTISGAGDNVISGRLDNTTTGSLAVNQTYGADLVWFSGGSESRILPAQVKHVLPGQKPSGAFVTAVNVAIDPATLTANSVTVSMVGIPGSSYSWEGDWSAGTYQSFDIVQNDDALWAALTSTTEEPTGTPTDWQKIADWSDAITARDAALAAQVAAENAAADAALDGGEFVAYPSLDDGKQEIFNEAGQPLVDLPENALDALPQCKAHSYWSSRGAYGGSRIDSDALLDTDSFTVAAPYAPPYDGCLWLRQPRVMSGGDLLPFVSAERVKSPEFGNERITLDTSTGLVIPASWASDYIAISQLYGHSNSKQSPDATAVTTTAIDTGIALMLDGNSTDAVDFGAQTPAGLIDARHATGGETPACGEHIGFVEVLEDAGGTKFPVAYVGNGIGSAMIDELLEDRANEFGYWHQHMRTATRIAAYANETDKKIIVLPPSLYHFDPDRSTVSPYGKHTTANYYLKGVERYADKYTEDIRAKFGWHTDAPPITPIIVQSTEQPKATWPTTGGGGATDTSTRAFGTATWGPRQGQFLAAVFSRKVVVAAPDYWGAHHTDNQHMTSTGHYQIGYLVGRARGNMLVQRGQRPVMPIKVLRNLDGVTIDIQFHIPDGGQLAFDTTTVPDLSDGFKGFVAWRLDTLAQVTISSVALTTTDSTNDTVRIVLASSVPNTTVPFISYAMFGDSRDYQNGRRNASGGGPRGCLRSNVAFASGHGNVYHWSLAFDVECPRLHSSSYSMTVRDLMRGYIQ